MPSHSTRARLVIAAAVMPESVRIQFEQAANVAGAGDFFDKLAAFWDKQISKGVLGQTMTADDGSSLSQAQVHQTVRLDIMTADARALSNTLQRHLVEPFCQLNFGPELIPRLSVVVPKPDNTAAMVDALAKLVPLGLRVEQSVTRDRLGLPDPDADSDVLQAPSQPGPVVPPAAAVADLGNGGADPSAMGGDVQTAALNGAQVKALQDLLGAASRGEIPIETAKAAIQGAFPLLTEQQVGSMITPLQSFKPPQPASNRAMNAEAPDSTPIAVMADTLTRQAAPAWKSILDHIRDLVDAAPDLPSLRDALLSAYADLPVEQLGEVMAMGLAAAELTGRYDLEQESGRG